MSTNYKTSRMRKVKRNPQESLQLHVMRLIHTSAAARKLKQLGTYFIMIKSRYLMNLGDFYAPSQVVIVHAGSGLDKEFNVNARAARIFGGNELMS